MTFQKSTICLSMIVKNEAHVIARCLASVRSHIDHYVIVDTGSTDRTKEVIAACMQGIPGEVIDRPWKDFGHNRTEALELARERGKTDYILIVDADDEIVGGKPLRLTFDAYLLHVTDIGQPSTYVRPHIIRANKKFSYRGRVHEYLACDPPLTVEQSCILPSLRYMRHVHEGARSQDDLREKYLRDAAVLEAQIREEPTNPDNARHWYYLGQSYMDAGEKAKAIAAFEKRAGLGGWDEEAYIAMMYLANYVRDDVSSSIDQVERAYLRAHNFRPSRLEALFHLCVYLNAKNQFARCFAVAKRGLGVVHTNDLWLVDHSIYAWQMQDVYALAAFYSGNKDICRATYVKLLAGRTVPPDQIARMKTNLQFCEVVPSSAEWRFARHHVEENHIESGFGPFLDMLKKQIGHGRSELGTQMMLFTLAVATRAETVIEVGRFRGASTYAITSALKFLDIGWREAPGNCQRPDVDYTRLETSKIDRKLFSIEIDPHDEAKEAIRNAGLEHLVAWIDKPSSEVTTEDLSSRKADIVFIDGDHSFQGCLNDVLRYTPMIRDGGYFILHDYVGWITPEGKNESPIKKVCDSIADDFEHILIDTHYMSFMIFRKRDKISERGSVPAPAAKAVAPISAPHLPKKYWGPRPEVVAYVEKLIQPGWKVLEIGPGMTPFSKATHFVDQPMGGQFIPRGRTSYVDVNANRLPFADKEFDFVYCRHCVEDLFNPDLLLSEMNRVGKAGYIETPSAIVELSRGVDGGSNPQHRGYIHHRWIAWDAGGEFQFVEKATCIEHMDIDDHAEALADPMQWNCYFLWQGELRFKHLQHTIDFTLQVDYGRVLGVATEAALHGATAMARKVR